MKTAIVIGLGPERGLGAQLCKRFAAEELKVIVAGRTKSASTASPSGPGRSTSTCGHPKRSGERGARACFCGLRRLPHCGAAHGKDCQSLLPLP